MVWRYRVTTDSADHLICAVIVGSMYPGLGVSIVGSDICQGSEDGMRRRGYGVVKLSKEMRSVLYGKI